VVRSYPFHSAVLGLASLRVTAPHLHVRQQVESARQLVRACMHGIGIDTQAQLRVLGADAETIARCSQQRESCIDACVWKELFGVT
jgi:hypothetical protein